MGNDAIKQTLEYIEAGDFPAEYSARDLGLGEFAENTGLPIIKMMYEAFSGSLDAAKALHEALMHEGAFVEIHWAGRYDNESRVTINKAGSGWYAGSGNPARAWLIAILRALEDSAKHEGGSNG